MPTFSEEFSRLNAEQKAAVETVEGPVMVVAGPGTGKTQVLSMRVANILKKTHARPSNILCLTFSTSGATAMRSRLRALIGSDAYGVTVSTIHGFANDIIQSNPLIFDDWSTLEQISDIERYRQLKKIIDSLLPDLVLVNKKHPYLRLKDILSRISECKREGKADADVLKQIAEEYAVAMESKSREGTKAHEKNVLSARKFADFVVICGLYQSMLRETGRYDYDDMILTVIAALREHDWLLAQLQERFQYILVDEFQDTNGAQYQLIDLLTTSRTPDDKPNIFIVGDDDQAIYRFQGANVRNILNFHERFKTAPIIVLTKSYRCSQPILDAASSVISRNTERLVGRIDGLTKDLIAAGKTNDEKPALLFSPSDATAPWLLADLIDERIAEGTLPQEIAVLTQTNGELRPIYDVLRARSIPVQLTGKLDLLQHPLVSQVIAIFEAVNNPEDNNRLASALGCACFGCHPADLGRIFQALPRDTSLLSYLLLFSVPESQDPVPLHQQQAIVHARDIILDLHQKTPSRSIIETFEHLLKETKILAESSTIDPLDYAAVQAFFDHIKYRAYEQPAYSAKSFASDLEYYQDPEYGDIRLTYDLPHLTDAGVALMTAHKSKGLEFDSVFLYNFREKHWDHRRKPAGVTVPEDLLYGAEKTQKTYEAEQDERRVTYVAMTRARKELFFLCPRQLTLGDQNKSVSPSAFFAEAGELPEREPALKNPEEASTLRFEIVRNLDDEYKTFLRHRLENFSLSVTALNHFLEDPKKFLESDLLQFPQSKQTNLVYGNAVHDALKHWSFGIQQGTPLSSEAFVRTFTKYLENREVLTLAEQRRLIRLGEEALPRYYASRLEHARPIIAFIEHPASAIVADVPLKGKFDRIDRLALESNRVRVIDYKTGHPMTESDIHQKGYHRQLAFYALLLEHGMPMLEPVEFILDFVGENAEHPIERTFQISTAEKQELTTVISAVWSKILALDFTPL